MDLLASIISGLLQGIFEWLPISSQGNIMAFLLSFFSMAPMDALKISVLLHSGTLMAAIIYFRKEFTQILSMCTREDKEFARFFIVATLSTAITAVPLYFLLKFALSETIGLTIPYLLFAIALMLIFTGFVQLNKKKAGLQSHEMKLTDKNALIAGLAQGFSVLPGISRSGTTAAALLFTNANPEQAFKLSFMMSIPAVLFAQIAFGFSEGIYLEGFALVSVLVAFIIGLVSIDFFIKIARKINFSYFCFFLALIYIIIFISMLI
jgi:undecaprenyl-diphosphatase